MLKILIQVKRHCNNMLIYYNVSMPFAIFRLETKAKVKSKNDYGFNQMVNKMINGTLLYKY